MTEDVYIGESKYILDWNNGYIMIIDLDLSKYIRFWIDDANDSINNLIKDLLFREVVRLTLKNNYGDWKSLKNNNEVSQIKPEAKPQEIIQKEAGTSSQIPFTF